MPRLVALLLLILTAIAAGVLSFLALQEKAPPANSDSVALYTSPPEPTPTPEPTTPPPPTAVFLGDSYVSGAGASGPATSWVGIVSATLGWQYENLGRGGTGYVATSSVEGCGLELCPSFVAMAEEAITLQPDVVVVAGGQNDFALFIQDPQVVIEAITATFQRLREGLPQARIIAVGPSTTSAISSAILAFDAAVQDAALSVNAEYLSLLAPDVISNDFVTDDGYHVDDRGHAAIAERFLATIS